MENKEFNSGRYYIIRKGSDLYQINVLRKTDKCYLIKFKDGEISHWYTKNEFHNDYETIECLFEYAGGLL